MTEVVSKRNSFHHAIEETPIYYKSMHAVTNIDLAISETTSCDRNISEQSVYKPQFAKLIII